MIRFFCLLVIFYSFLNKPLIANEKIDKIFKYLQNFDSIKSDFIQVNNNGDLQSGKIFLFRPGKIRIEYSTPPLLIMSDGKKIATINKKTKNIAFYSIDDVPIKLLLFKKFNKNSINIIKFEDINNQFKIILSQLDSKDQGFIEIIFEKKPFQMKKWTIFKSDGSKTEVLFNNLKLNEKIDPIQFDIKSEDPRNPIWRN